MQILCFGDSNTYGYNPRGFLGGRYDAGNRWPHLLATQTSHTMINAGLNGRQIPRSAEFPPADVLLVMLGTNDLLQGASAAEAAGKMEAFLRASKPQCKRILLVAPPPMKRGAWVPEDSLVAESVRLGLEYRMLAETLGVSFVDTGSWNVELTFDGVHFTEAGHHTFASLIAEYL